MRARPLLLVAGIALLAGCAGLLGFDDFVAGTAAPDGGESGATDAGPTGGLEEAEADWYVSPTGDDASDGSRDHPLRTLGEAAARAGQSAPSEAPRTIALCRGDYTIDPLKLVGRVEVFGGYDCTSWSRTVATDDGIGATAGLTKLSGSASSQALIRLEPDESGAPRLDRLDVRGSNVQSVILSAGDTVLTQLTVTNATGHSTGGWDQTFGIVVSTSTASTGDASVEHCTVSVLPSFGDAEGAVATGIVVQGSRHRVRRNVVTVGGVKGSGFGVVVVEGSVATVIENDVSIFDCLPTNARAALGLSVRDAKITSARNSIHFEAVGNADAAASASVVGLSVGVTSAGRQATLDSDGDRVFGPVFPRPDRPAQLVAFKGFEDLGGWVTRIVNASIVLDSGYYALGGTAGIYIIGPSSAILAHNSMYFARSGTKGAVVDTRGIFVTHRPEVDAGASDVTIASNFVASDDPRMTFVYSRCESDLFASVAHNRYGRFDSPAAACDGGSFDALWPDAGADDNVAITCPADGTCASLFASVSAGSDTLRLTDAGCALATGVPSRPDVPIDGAGRARGATTTAGAFECE